MNPRSVTLVLLALAVIGAAGWFALQDRPAADVPSTPPSASPPQAPHGPATLPATRPGAPKPVATVKAPTDPGRYVLLPDGSYAPALNNIYGAPAMDWPPEVPWSPIVGKELDQRGLEWYVHADGSKTTTMKVWRSDLGREAPVTYVANPTTPLPLLQGEGPLDQASRPGSQPTR